MWLLIDDVRDLSCDVIVRDALSAYVILRHMGRTFKCVCFDHDLGTDETGYDVLKYALEKDYLPNRVQLVTSNPVGRTNMQNLLKDHGWTSSDGINFYRQS